MANPNPTENVTGAYESFNCVFCGEEIKRYPDHLPCEGVDE